MTEPHAAADVRLTEVVLSIYISLQIYGRLFIAEDLELLQPNRPWYLAP